MRIYSWIVAACWVVFLIYWLVAATGAKRNAKSGARQILARVIVAIGAALLIRSRGVGFGLGSSATTISNPAVRVLGVLLCAAGIGYAVWARRHIGKNWGMPMSVKEQPELVSSGPYARSRHPIYGGVLIALVGSALAVNLAWFVVAGVALVYFVYAARKEEKTMLDAFPRDYADYQRRTKMIVPFVF